MKIETVSRILMMCTGILCLLLCGCLFYLIEKKGGDKMNIDRRERQGVSTAKDRITFCLDQLEKARNFKKGIDWNTEVVQRLTTEEMIGALVSAEQEIIEEE